MSLSSMNDFSSAESLKPVKAAKKSRKRSSVDVKESFDRVSMRVPKIKLETPRPFDDITFNFLSEMDPLPPYVHMEGGYKIDCVYVSQFDYYNIWETNKLNPYGFNGEHFSDTLLILLQNFQGEHWVSPLDKTIITSDFGLRRASWHYGTDFRVNTGTPVYAVSDGVVRIMAYERRGFGRFIVVRHDNGLETLYAHLSKSLVRVGDVISRGQEIGKGGNTGRSTAPHLHFEIRYSGNAIDPNTVYDFKENRLIKPDITLDVQSFAYLEEANKIRFHVVRSGNTLSGVGYRYGVSINKLCSLNGISRNSILRIGQRIRIN
jgi:LysM repeat protein